MAKLTKKLISFLKNQEISLSMVFDGSNLTRFQIKEIMTENETYFYFGGAKCKETGHGLRSKAGHCIQCNTARIAYQLRSTSAGFVYFAYSASLNLIKIGYTKNQLSVRKQSLVKTGYGGTKDWDIYSYHYFEKNAGRAEFFIHNAFSNFNSPTTYNRGNLSVDCRELFECEVNLALAKFSHYVNEFLTD
jgi:hypothetical protein